eukprot:Anaeramoba_flamelloidesa567561_49.p1 GENE.a567561_49~~a567561_49.p1  ORF type:complete len:554 (+),score=169.84 a567561_49:46-1707(+)
MDKDQQENEIIWNYSHTAGKGDLVVHPNGEYFFTAGSDGVIRIFPTNDSMEMECKEFTNNEGSVNCLTVSPDGVYLASGSEDNKVLLFNCSELKFEKILTQTQTAINCLTFSPDSSFLAVGSESSEIKIVPLDDPTSHYFLKGHAGPVKALSWDPQGTFLASASEDGSVRIFNVDDRQEVKVIPSIEGKEENGDKQLYRLSWSNDGDYLAIAGSFGEKIPFFKRSSMMNLFTLYTDHIKSISIVKFSPDGIHFASVGCDNKVYLWDLEEKKVVNCFEHGSTIYGIDWNSTKNEIILIDENGELGRWAKPVKEVIKQASSSSSSSSSSASNSESESESEPEPELEQESMQEPESESISEPDLKPSPIYGGGSGNLKKNKEHLQSSNITESEIDNRYGSQSNLSSSEPQNYRPMSSNHDESSEPNDDFSNKNLINNDDNSDDDDFSDESNNDDDDDDEDSNDDWDNKLNNHDDDSDDDDFGDDSDDDDSGDDWDDQVNNQDDSDNNIQLSDLSQLAEENETSSSGMDPSENSSSDSDENEFSNISDDSFELISNY